MITILLGLVGLVVLAAVSLAGALIMISRADRRELRRRRQRIAARSAGWGHFYQATGTGEPYQLPEWTRRDAQFPINKPYGHREDR